MIEWILSIWKSLPPEVQEILRWVFDKHLQEVVIILLALLPWLARHKISRIFNRFRTKKIVYKKLPYLSKIEIDRGLQYYIWPDCQSIDPAQRDEVRDTVAVRNDLCREMDRLLKQDKKHKHFILLADTGMGKTSFLLNYFARHVRRWRKPYKVELIPLSLPGLKKKLENISKPENTVLLLDAFDEDSEAIKNHVLRLTQILAWTRNFHAIVITCRTQFFPRDEEIPVETGIIKVGPRSAGEGPQYTFFKIYLSPFSDDDVKAYLKRRFPIWRFNCRKKAQNIVKQIPNLIVRPMLLAYVDDLINSGKTFNNSFQIYDEMVDAWFDRERKIVENKKALSDFSDKLAIDLFLNRESRGGERIPYQEIHELAQSYDIPIETWQLTGRSLLNRDAEGNFKFAHRSILEFLVAKRILAEDPEVANLTVDQWTEPIMTFFAEGLEMESDYRIMDNFYKKFSAKKTDITTFVSSKIMVSFNGGQYTVHDTNKKVEVKPFALGIRPVTNKEYGQFDPAHRRRRNKYSNQDDQPVVNVSWQEAIKYCQWLSEQTGKNYRLPTEAEWEFAAGGGSKREYPWGNETPTPKHANYADSKIGKTTPVGSYPLGMTPEGLFDMAGNVWEWCDDWYDEKRRVLRGGSFDGYGYYLRCSYRNGCVPAYRNDFYGFRVACSH
ncbi:SUMF1/EgtB/PvdO family nonheme iron enzyme [candidate division KSB1 bacterium]|nr:SUMF1/EgtB/PvdO family nonheme iron enzyme [candidate division KSB1 bacterium]